MNTNPKLVPMDQIESRILLIRGKKVLVDADLASFYGVETKRLNEQVKRNGPRFPEDFVFRLSLEEKNEVVANCDHLSRLKYSNTLPLAFTEHGAIMVANVLNSSRAVEMGVFVVRAFISLRQNLADHEVFAKKLSQLERHLIEHDQKILSIVEALRTLLGETTIPPKRKNWFSKRVNDYFCYLIFHPLAAYPRNIV